MIYAVCSSVVISVVPTVWIHGLGTAGDRRPPSQSSAGISKSFLSSREEMKKLIITDKFFAVLSSMQER